METLLEEVQTEDKEPSKKATAVLQESVDRIQKKVCISSIPWLQAT